MRQQELLELVSAHLKHVREIQLREHMLTKRGANWEHWVEIADSHKPIDLPQPERWRIVGESWSRALDAVCRGDLRRAHR